MPSSKANASTWTHCQFMLVNLITEVADDFFPKYDGNKILKKALHTCMQGSLSRRNNFVPTLLSFLSYYSLNDDLQRTSVEIIVQAENNLLTALRILNSFCFEGKVFSSTF
jgi:hypothetical protein